MNRPNQSREVRQSGWQRDRSQSTVWLFGLHAVRAALCNPARTKHRLLLTRNAAAKLASALETSGMRHEEATARRFPAPIDPNSVHQGAALEVSPLESVPAESIAGLGRPGLPIILLDRITDPHNVGAIIRSAGALGAAGIITPARHSPPETGALAKSASGALEEVPYARVRNLATAMKSLHDCGVALVGFDADAEHSLDQVVAEFALRPVGLVFGSEGAGLRAGTKENCDRLATIGTNCGSGSLNVSNAAAIALYRFTAPHADA